MTIWTEKGDIYLTKRKTSFSERKTRFSDSGGEEIRTPVLPGHPGTSTELSHILGFPFQIEQCDQHIRKVSAFMSPESGG